MYPRHTRPGEGPSDDQGDHQAAGPAAGFRPGHALWLVAALLVSAPGTYAAATAPDEDTAAPRVTLQEIVVHARRRDERLEDAPLAISVRSGEQLRDDLALLLEDLGRDGVYVANGQGAMGTLLDVDSVEVVRGSQGDLLLRADYAWQDKIEFNVINDFNYRGAYGTANARVALASRARSWELAVFGTNLTDYRWNPER